MTGMPEARRPVGNVLRSRFGILLAMLAVMWLVEILDRVAFDSTLEAQGITPRALGGLDGIAWAPFLHGSFGHLLSNTVPFLILGGLVMLAGLRRWVTVSIFIAFVGGLATWLFARSAVHIGASMLVFGYAAHLIVVGFLERRARGILIAVLVALFYGSTLLFGVLPVRIGVSWEGHLFGAAAGVAAAFIVEAGRKPAGGVAA
jgi:membrane associated rhomboid family serine protease